MYMRSIVALAALWPGASTPRVASLTSISYVSTYTPTTPVRIWRGVDAELTVRGASVGLASRVEVLTPRGVRSLGISARISAAATTREGLKITISSESNAPLGTYNVILHYVTNGSNPDAFPVRLYDHGTVTGITMDGGVSGDIKPGKSYSFTATGTSLSNAEIDVSRFGTAAGVKDVRVMSRSSNGVQVSFTPVVGETSIQIEPSLFFDRNMSMPTGAGPWSYGGAGAVTVRTATVTPVSLNLSAPSVVEGQQLRAVVKMNGFVSATGKAAVTLRSSSAGVSIPDNVLVVGDSAPFTVTAAPNAGMQQVTLTAERGNVTVTRALSVQPLTPTLQSVKFVDPALEAMASAQISSLPEGKQMVVSLNSPVVSAAGVTIHLTANPPGAVTIPASITIPGGQTSGTFTVVGKPTDVDQVVYVAATLGKQSPSRSITVQRTTFRSIEPLQAEVPFKLYSGELKYLAATLNGLAVSTKTVQLTSSRPDALASYALVSISPGQSRATTSVRGKPVTADQDVELTGSLDGVSKSMTISVMRLPIVTSLTVGTEWFIGRFGVKAVVDRDPPQNLSILFTNDNPSRIDMDPYVEIGMQVLARTAISYVKMKTSTGTKKPSYVAANIVEYAVDSPVDTLPATVTMGARVRDTVNALHPGVTLTLQLRPYILSLNHVIGTGSVTEPTMTVSVNHSGGATIAISSPNAAGKATFPATVVIPYGLRTATYPVTLAPGATINGLTFTATLGTLTKSITVP